MNKFLCGICFWLFWLYTLEWNFWVMLILCLPYWGMSSKFKFKLIGIFKMPNFKAAPFTLVHLFEYPLPAILVVATDCCCCHYPCLISTALSSVLLFFFEFFIYLPLGFYWQKPIPFKQQQLISIFFSLKAARIARIKARWSIRPFFCLQKLIYGLKKPLSGSRALQKPEESGMLVSG